MNDEVVRTFATQIERNSVAIRNLKRSNKTLGFLVFGLACTTMINGIELYMFEKNSNKRYYKSEHKKD